MIYRQDRKQRVKKKLGIFAIVAFSAYILLFTGVFKVFAAGMQRLAVHVWSIGSAISELSNELRATVVSKKTLLNENRRLKESIKAVEAQLVERDMLYRENLMLKDALGRQKERDSVFATVLSRPNKTLYDTLIIDVGSGVEGVRIGDEVVYGGSIAVGRIVEVYPSTSKVLLYSSPGEQRDVFVGDDGILTTAHGRGAGSFELTLPRDVEVDVGDPVYVPGIHQKIFGFVKSIDAKPSDPFKTVIVAGPVNVFTVKWVEVLKEESGR